MSQEKRELSRPFLAEWAKGNLWAGTELMAPDITFQAAMPASFVAQGLEETARQVLEVLAHWSDYRIERRNWRISAKTASSWRVVSAAGESSAALRPTTRSSSSGSSGRTK